jgi:hypothetical protein
MNPLSDEKLAKISLHSLLCLFILVIALFDVQPLFNLIQSHLPILGIALIFWAIGDLVRK